MIKSEKWLEILKLFVESKDIYLSGQEIGKKLNISRSSVWKHIKSLQEKGFVFDGKTNTGYKLHFPIDTPITVDAEEFNTTCFGKNVIPLIETESTNDVLKKLGKNIIHGTLAITEKQTKGRGRRGRQWSSPFGSGLYFSIFLKPDLPVYVIPRLTILTGVAVSESLEKFGVKTKLKWPNDIMIGDKKIGGILSEMALEGNEIDYVILGIGLNVHSEYRDFPPDFRDKAGSIKTETGKNISRQFLIKEIIYSLEKRYLEFCKNNGLLGEIRTLWERRAYGINKKVFITTGKDKELCIILGLKEDGTLLVKTLDGAIKEIFAGEVLF